MWCPTSFRRSAELSGTRQGEQIVFTWVNRDPQEGDTFIWNVVDVSGQVDPQQSERARRTGGATAGNRVHRCDAAPRRRSRLRARPRVRRRMIWEIDDQKPTIEGLDAQGRADPAYAAALGLLRAPFGRRALAATIDVAIWLILLLPFAIGAVPLLLQARDGGDLARTASSIIRTSCWPS